MTARDLLALAVQGLSSRRSRTALSALGIALGIAALVGVLGLSESSKAGLNAQLKALGTNMLTVTPGQSFGGSETTLPDTAGPMIARIPTVETASAVRVIPKATVRKTNLIPSSTTSGLQAASAEVGLLHTVGAELADGRWLDAATQRYPAVVLGDAAGRRLQASVGDRIWLDGRWFAVIGVLKPAALAPQLDDLALMGNPIADRLYGSSLSPSTIYTRVQDGAVDATRNLLAQTANPAHPESVKVSRPSDALAAKAAVDQSFRTLTLGLGAVALLVGSVGIANVMVISVLERRREIGVRRSLGATRTDIAGQFLTEAMLLSVLGGISGAVLGLIINLAWSLRQGWTLIIPWAPVGLGLVGSLLIGTLVGVYPALRAASVPPTEALRSV